MSSFANLPTELEVSVGSEKKDFSFKAKRNKPLRTSIGLIVFSLFWLSFTSIFVFGFFGPLFAGKEVHFTVNDVPTVASIDNLEPLIMPGVIIGLFVLVGLGIFIGGIYSMVVEGGWFVGTEKRLIIYRKNNIRSIDWEQFNGDISVRGNVNIGDITMNLRTGKMVSQKNGPSRYVPEIIYMSGIVNPYEIERMCQKRIKENDPTPVID